MEKIGKIILMGIGVFLAITVDGLLFIPPKPSLPPLDIKIVKAEPYYFSYPVSWHSSPYSGRETVTYEEYIDGIRIVINNSETSDLYVSLFVGLELNNTEIHSYLKLIEIPASQRIVEELPQHEFKLGKLRNLQGDKTIVIILFHSGVMVDETTIDEWIWTTRISGSHRYQTKKAE